jgi:enoyl-CoA hydratase/carnithine racemase
MFYSSERVKGDRALAMGLIDRLVPEAEIRQCARGMAHEIAASGPLAVQSIRRALRADYESRFCLAIQQEMLAQDGLLATEDYKEGVRAMVERRVPQFKGR